MFTRRVDDELELELLHVGLARDLFLTVDDSREHLREWLTWVDDTKQILDTREFLRLSMAGWAEGRMLRTAIRWNGRICGSVSIEGITAEERGEIGYWLAHDCGGHGIMTRCVAKIARMGFDELGLHRLQLRAAEGNARSWAIPERLGWIREGTLRGNLQLRDVWHDVRLYSRLSTDA